MVRASERQVQKMLKDYLEELKRLFRSGYELGVIWVPKESSSLSGEVRNETIIVYEKDPQRARKTLIHEFLDYMISSVYKPSVNLLNLMIKGVNEEVYRRKEGFIESLIELIEPKIRQEDLKRRRRE